MNCNQSGCDKHAVARFTWPGRDEAGICAGHLPALRKIANAMGLPLQTIPIEPAWSEAVAAELAAYPLIVGYACGCSPEKVKLGRCDVFGPDGKERVP